MRSALRALALAALLPLSTGGCASFYLHRAPPSPREPWPLPTETARPSERATGAPGVAPDHVYTLTELIDLAESTNPDTRIGWQKARQAAIAVGIPIAGYFPKLEAITFVAYEHTIFPASNPSMATIGTSPSPMMPTISSPLPMPSTPPSGSIGVDTWQVLPFVLATVELLNLGRAAEVRGAKHQSTAANALFTAEHERVIFEVARAYFRANAARTQLDVSKEALDRTRATAKAAEARFAQGVATAVERSQAQREVAQAEYSVAQAQSLAIAAHASLVSAMGIDARAPLEVAANPSGPLPSHLERNVDGYVGEALSARADLRAARAQVPATDAGVSKSLAAYAPRIDAFGTAGGILLGGNVEGTDLPGHNLPVFTAGLNFHWLLFDGGLRELQAATARSQAAQAKESLVKLERQVVQEVVTAYNEVNASLSRYQSATALLDTATVAEDAATKSYVNGLSTLTDAMNAQKARALASGAKEQAFADALVAQTNLAFAAGELLSARAVPHSP